MEIVNVNASSHASNAREVRIERWAGRPFYVVACPFRVDLPLDMSGCIVSALRETIGAGHRRPHGGLILASDARGRGAVYIEVDPPRTDDSRVCWIEGDLLTRALPPPPTPLRAEVDELVRWSGELAREVGIFYVSFAPGEGPRAFRPVRLLAALDGGGVVEHFEVRTSKQYVSARAVAAAR